MVCALSDIPLYKSERLTTTNKETDGSSQAAEAVRPPPVMPPPPTQSIHRRVVELEAENAYMSNMITRLRAIMSQSHQTSSSSTQYPNPLRPPTDAIDIVLLASVTVLVVVVCKIIAS